MAGKGRIAELEARIEAVKDLIEGGYPAMPDPLISGQCVHGQFDYEDCISCYDAALLAALEPPCQKP